MTGSQDCILLRDEDGVRSIVLNRPAKANALTAQMLGDMTHAVESAQAAGIHVIVLRSASRGLFCAGGDIGEFSAGPAQLEKQGSRLRELMTAMARCPLPIVAIARGKAAGAGAILLAMTDIVIAAESLVFSCPELAFNMYPFIVQAALETKISAARARQLCFSGAPLDARSALELGLATDVLADDCFDNSADERLAYYLLRREALEVAREGRLLMEPPEHLLHKIQALEPLMHENFGKPGVQGAIKAYLERLSAKVD